MRKSGKGVSGKGVVALSVNCRAEWDIAVQETVVESDGDAIFVAGESSIFGQECSVVGGGRMRVVIMENPAP